MVAALGLLAERTGEITEEHEVLAARAMWHSTHQTGQCSPAPDLADLARRAKVDPMAPMARSARAFNLRRTVLAVPEDGPSRPHSGHILEFYRPHGCTGQLKELPYLGILERPVGGRKKDSTSM